jgi:MFS family permease
MSFTLLLVGRFVIGLFSSGLGPAAFGLVADVTPREEQGAANGAVFSARAFALGIASMVGGVLASWVGLRGLFWIGGLGLIGLTVLSVRRLTSGIGRVEPPVA